MNSNPADLNDIAIKSFRFLDDADNRDWAAYPASELPFPKETMKQAIIEYVLVHGEHMESLKIEVIIYRYALLASFADEDDAALLNSMALRQGQTGMQYKERMKTVELPDSLHGTEVFRRYLAISEKMAAESEAMRVELRSIAERVVTRA